MKTTTKTSLEGETLDCLSVGTPAAVLCVHGQSRSELRLQELGFVPGADVEVLCGDEPMLVRIGDHRLSLRHDAAKSISVYPLC